MSNSTSIDQLKTDIIQMLSDVSIIKLKNFIYKYATVLQFNTNNSILKDSSESRKIEFYDLLNKNVIDVNIQEDDLFSKKIKLYGKNYKYYPAQKSNLIIEDIDLSYFVNTKIKILLFYLNFLEQFYKNITDYLNNNYKVDNNIYNHKFVIFCNYKLDESTNTLVSLEKSYKVFLKLNKKFFQESIGEPFIFELGEDKRASDKINTVNYLFENVNKDDLKNNFNIVITNNTWAKTKTGYVVFEFLKLKLNHMLLVIIYSYLSDNSSWQNKLINFTKIIELNNNILDNKKLILESELKIINDSIIKSSDKVTEESDKIKEAINTTNKLKNINNAIEEKSQKLNSLNNNINYERNKLNKINSVLIVSILLFILLSSLLIFIKYAKKPIIYTAILVTVILYIIIYMYISSIKNSSKAIAEHFNVDNNSILKESDSKISYLKRISEDIITKNTENTNSYYDIINPLLNNELKNFQKKSYNNKLYDKIAQFNLNVSKRDIKYNVETIIFLMNLSLLLLLLILSIYYMPNNIILAGSIALIIFVLLAIIYFARILRVVRTKSNNFYWNKPVKEKEIV